MTSKKSTSLEVWPLWFPSRQLGLVNSLVRHALVQHFAIAITWLYLSQFTLQDVHPWLGKEFVFSHDFVGGFQLGMIL